MRYILICLPSVLFLVGCGEAPVPLHPVSGKVMLGNTPLHKGEVRFIPDASKGNGFLQFGIGKIAADGTYTAKTFQDEGVKPGWYRVTIFATENEPQESLSWVPIWIVPVKYTKPETTDLLVEVVPEPAPGAYDLNLVPNQE